MTDREFLSHFRVIVAAALLVVAAGFAWQTTNLLAAMWDIHGRMEFYEQFGKVIEEPLCKAVSEPRVVPSRFGTRVETLFNRQATTNDQLTALFSLVTEHENEFEQLLQFVVDEPDVVYVLLTTSSLPLLLNEQQVLWDNIPYDPLVFERLALGILLWFGPIVLIQRWHRVGYNELWYLPFKRWWFYPYLLLTFPTSLLLVTVVAIRELHFYWGHTRSETRERWHGEPHTYELRCAALRLDKDDYKRRWLKIFSAQRVGLIRKREQERADQLRDRLENLQAELAQLQAPYFEIIDRLNFPGLERANEQRLAAEFDRLHDDERILAITIGDEQLTIYTDKIASVATAGTHRTRLRSGMTSVGPFRVVIDLTRLDERYVRVYPAHEDARQHRHGAFRMEYGRYCFGTAAGLITDLLKEYRISEAVGMIFAALESS